MKRIFILLLAVMMTSVAFSQNFSIKAGFNSTTEVLKLGSESDSYILNGFYIGILEEFDLSDMTTVQPELQYVNVTRGDLNYSFLNLPVMFGYRIADQFMLQAGPQFSLLLDDKVDNYTNFGLDLGIGAKAFFNENIFADARYNFGLTNHYTGLGSGDYKDKYNSFQIGLGYKF